MLLLKSNFCVSTLTMYYVHKRLMLSFVMFIVLSSIFCAAANKYSEKTNSESESESKKDQFAVFEENAPFRMKKVNLLWTKAKKFVSGQKLAELYADLKLHDREEAHLKKLRSLDADKDGRKEAQVLESYKYILEYYGLDDFNKDNFANEVPMSNDEIKGSLLFQDPKLQSMWKRAEKAGFSDEDLKTLKEEFWHQQMKLNEYDFLRREMTKEEVPEENDVEDIDRQMSKDEKMERMTNLKKHTNEIKEGYMYLEHLAITLPKQQSDFKDYRVQKLWALARKTNWTQEQMISFKEELKHFEHRLSKHDYYQEQLELTRDSYRGQMENDNDYLDKYKELKEKTNMVKQKVKKLHNHINGRLEKALRHTEL